MPGHPAPAKPAPVKPPAAKPTPAGPEAKGAPGRPKGKDEGHGKPKEELKDQKSQ